MYFNQIIYNEYISCCVSMSIKVIKTKSVPNNPKNTTTKKRSLTGGNPRCTFTNSIFDPSVPDWCIKPQIPTPLADVVKNAVDLPVNLVKEKLADTIVSLVATTGGETAANLISKNAATAVSKDMKTINNILENKIVQKEMKELSDNVTKEFSRGIDNLSQQIQEPVASLVTNVAEGAIDAVENVAKNSPIGVVLTFKDAVDKVNDVAKNATDMIGIINDSVEPVKKALEKTKSLEEAIASASKPLTTAVTDAKNTANAAANAAVTAANDTANAAANAAVTAANDTANAAKDTAVTAANDTVTAAKDTVTAAKDTVTAAKDTVTDVTDAKDAANAAVTAANDTVTDAKDTAKAATTETKGKRIVGGSRKRQIYKISRRVQRTLRRIKQKCGLKNKFLSKTFNSKYFKK
jgi:small subunit ribosomal protein S3